MASTTCGIETIGKSQRDCSLDYSFHGLVAWDSADAFNVALNLEESAGELHFQNAMEQPPTSSLMGLFQMLNGEDKEHATRIRTYMRDNGIEIRGKLAK